MEHRPLGASGFRVSELSLGSWRTYERISKEEGIAVLNAAREAGIDFLDDARYDDETGTAPLSTGYSEVVFGELFRASGWRRDDAVVANKLWWEFWPEQSAADELDRSLARMGFGHLDLVYSAEPPAGLRVDELVGMVGGLIETGKARAWGVLNWPADLIAEATRCAADGGVQQPCAAQLAYSLAYLEPVEDVKMVAALESAGAGVVASAVLAGGALSGKYGAGARGRLSDGRASEERTRTLELGDRLRAFAEQEGTSPARLALAFALAHPRVASVLFGATSPEQVRENVAALETLGRLGSDGVRRLRELAATKR